MTEHLRERRAGPAPRHRRDTFKGFENRVLLEQLLAYAVRGRKDLGALSATLVERFSGLRGVLDATPEDLKGAAGLGESSVVFLKLVKETAGAYLKEKMMGRDAIRNMKDVLDYLSLTLSGERVEKFLAVYLNAKNEVISVDTLHEGTINQTVVYPRKAIERAFKHDARAVIFVHNHPSGDATPSSVDRQLAKTLDRAALAVDLIVHDHIIIGKNANFSARENGWIIGFPMHASQARD